MADPGPKCPVCGRQGRDGLEIHWPDCTRGIIHIARAEGERAGRAVEREACAKLANPPAPNGMVSDYEEGWIDACEKIAAAIRARSEGERTP